MGVDKRREILFICLIVSLAFVSFSIMFNRSAGITSNVPTNYAQTKVTDQETRSSLTQRIKSLRSKGPATPTSMGTSNAVKSAQITDQETRSTLTERIKSSTGPAIPASIGTSNFVKSEDGVTRSTIFRKRKALVAKVCSETKDLFRETPSVSSQDPAFYQHFLVDDKNKILYCCIPKIGSTSWATILRHSSCDISKESSPPVCPLNYLARHSWPEIQSRLATYTKFMITRDPFSRIYSGYKDKFIRRYSIYGKRFFERQIMETFPELPRTNGEFFVSFDKAVQMLVAGKSAVRQNKHFQQEYQLCHPCEIDYDIIAKLETLDEDKETLLKLFNATELGHSNSDHQQSNIFDFNPPPMQEAYATVPEETLKQLVNVFKLDFEMFGYSTEIPNKTVQ